MFNKLFGGNQSQGDQSAASKVKKKKNGAYFLELDESEGTQAVASAPAAPSKPVEEMQPEPVKTAEIVEETKPEPVKTAQPVEEKKPEPVKAQSTKKKKTKKKSTQAASVPSKVPEWEQPAWVKAIKNYSNNGKAESESESGMTFATQYLMPIPSNSRRRPGPSLNKFREMARQAKTPRV